jgi:hypothetical protein
MSSLEKHIENIGWRFLGMKKERSVINGATEIITRIEIDFKPGISDPDYRWQIFGLPNNVPVNEQVIKCVKRKSEDHVYYLFSTTKDIGFIELIKHAQTIVDVNTSIEEKRSLLALKIEELTKLFSELEYNELKTLTFKYKQKRKKNVVIKEEIVEQEINNTPNTN